MEDEKKICRCEKTLNREKVETETSNLDPAVSDLKQIVVIAFGNNFDRLVIGRIGECCCADSDNIDLYDVFEIISDENPKQVLLTNFAKGTISLYLKIPKPYVLGYPDPDVLESYHQASKKRKEMAAGYPFGNQGKIIQ